MPEPAILPVSSTAPEREGVAALLARGKDRYARGDLPGALADFERTIRLDPAHPGGYINRGVVRYAGGDLDGALADMDAALRLDPADADAYSNRGAARHAAGDLDGALSDFDAAIALSPGSAVARHNRGAVHLARLDFVAAIADLDAALAIDPRLCRAYIARGNARYHRRDPAAFLDYRAAFALDPTLTARSLLRIFLGDGQEPDDVLGDCEKHLRANPDDLLACARRGLILLSRGDDAQAEADFAHFLRRNPKGRANLQAMIAEVLRLRALA